MLGESHRWGGQSLAGMTWRPHCPTDAASDNVHTLRGHDFDKVASVCHTDTWQMFLLICTMINRSQLKVIMLHVRNTDPQHEVAGRHFLVFLSNLQLQQLQIREVRGISCDQMWPQYIQMPLEFFF